MTAAPGSSVKRPCFVLAVILQELNNRLAAEIARLRTLLTGDAGGEAAGSPLTQGKDAYELEVLLITLHHLGPHEDRVAPVIQNRHGDDTYRWQEGKYIERSRSLG